MKIKLQIQKGNSILVERVAEVFDAETFGQACAEAFAELRSRELTESSSVGGLMDMLNMSALEVLNGATIGISKA